VEETPRVQAEGIDVRDVCVIALKTSSQ